GWEAMKKLLLVLIVLAGIIVTHAIWLRWMGEFLIVQDELRAADVIVAVSGDASRNHHAIRLYKAGYAPTLLFNLGPLKTWVFGKELDLVHLARQGAQELGVNLADLLIQEDCVSTQADALYTKQHLQKLGAKTAIIVSSPFHMRRVALAFDRVFRGTGIDLIYAPVPLEAEDMALERWWTRDPEVIMVNNEYLKLLSYLF
ncbi:MAG: YdcF family protein, partial [Candidatus Entotheonellia bacterium]